MRFRIFRANEARFVYALFGSPTWQYQLISPRISSVVKMPENAI